jgi:hypothetical protein
LAVGNRSNGFCAAAHGAVADMTPHDSVCLTLDHQHPIPNTQLPDTRYRVKTGTGTIYMNTLMRTVPGTVFCRTWPFVVKFVTNFNQRPCGFNRVIPGSCILSW